MFNREIANCKNETLVSRNRKEFQQGENIPIKGQFIHISPEDDMNFFSRKVKILMNGEHSRCRGKKKKM